MSHALRTFIRESLLMGDQKILREGDATGKVAVPEGIVQLKAYATAQGHKIKTANDVTGPQWKSIEKAEELIKTRLPALAAQIDKSTSGWSADPGLVFTDADFDVLKANIISYLKQDQLEDAGFPYATILYIAAVLGEDETIATKIGEFADTAGDVMYISTLILPLIDLRQANLQEGKRTSHALLGKSSARYAPLGSPRHMNMLNEGWLGTMIGNTGGISARIFQAAVKGTARAVMYVIDKTASLVLRDPTKFSLAVSKSPEILGARQGAESVMNAAGISGGDAADLVRVVTYGSINPVIDVAKGSSATAAVLTNPATLRTAAVSAGVILSDDTVTKALRSRQSLITTLGSFSEIFMRHYAATTRLGKVVGTGVAGVGAYFTIWSVLAGVLGLADAVGGDDADVVLDVDQVAGIVGAQTIRIKSLDVIEKLRAYLADAVVADVRAVEGELQVALESLRVLCNPNVTVFQESEDYNQAILDWETLG